MKLFGPVSVSLAFKLYRKRRDRGIKHLFRLYGKTEEAKSLLFSKPFGSLYFNIYAFAFHIFTPRFD